MTVTLLSNHILFYQSSTPLVLKILSAPEVLVQTLKETHLRVNILYFPKHVYSIGNFTSYPRQLFTLMQFRKKILLCTFIHIISEQAKILLHLFTVHINICYSGQRNFKIHFLFLFFLFFTMLHTNKHLGNVVLVHVNQNWDDLWYTVKVSFRLMGKQSLQETFQWYNFYIFIPDSRIKPTYNAGVCCE